MAGRNPLIPEGWTVKRGSVVLVEPTKDEPVPPPGVWKVLDKAPGTSQWWLQGVDDDARLWLVHHSDQAQSGCISRPGRALCPKGYRKPSASDLSARALQSMAAPGGRR